MLKRIVFFILTPALVPAAFYRVASLPADALGCRERGLAAFLIAVAGMLGGWALTIHVLQQKRQGRAVTRWWILSALILVAPAMVLLALLGR